MLNYYLSENPEMLFILGRDPMQVCIIVEFLLEKGREKRPALQVFLHLALQVVGTTVLATFED